MTFHTWIILILSLLGLRMVTFPLPGWPEEAGSPVKIQVQETVLHDTQRQRDLPLRLYLPTPLNPNTRYPLILFSPGAGGAQDSYDYLGAAWAQHGYLVICVDHPGTDLAAIPRYPKLMDFYVDIATHPALRLARLQDISFVLDSLPTLEQQILALKGKLDTHHIGIGGHSLGAWTTLVLAGAKMAAPPSQKKRFYGEPRALAFLSLSPLGNGQLDMTKNSWASIQAPTMTMGGTNDGGPGVKSPLERMQPFLEMPPTGDKYFVLQKAAEHLDFADKDLPTERIATIHQAVEAYSLLFWDAYLKQDRSALQALKSPNASNAQSTVYQK